MIDETLYTQELIAKPEDYYLDNHFVGGKCALFEGSCWSTVMAYSQVQREKEAKRENKMKVHLLDANEKSIAYRLDLCEQQQVIDHESWVYFWRYFNILQFSKRIKLMPKVVEEKPSVPAYDEVVDFFPGLEKVVKELLDNGVPFNYEGGYTVRDKKGNELAEAAIKIDNKQVLIFDIPEEEIMNRKKIMELGYTILTPETFHIDKI